MVRPSISAFTLVLAVSALPGADAWADCGLSAKLGELIDGFVPAKVKNWQAVRAERAAIEREYPDLRPGPRRDFSEAVRLMRGRRPPIIGLPIVERVLYRMGVGGMEAAWDTVLSVHALDPGFLGKIQEGLKKMPDPVETFLLEKKSEVLKRAEGYEKQGKLTYRELIELSREFSALAGHLSTPPAGMRSAFPEHLDDLVSWRQRVVGPLIEERMSKFLSKGRVPVPFFGDRSQEEIASFLSHNVPVELVGQAKDADGLLRSPWNYSWVHDLEGHGSVLRSGDELPSTETGRFIDRDFSPADLRRTQERAMEFENAIGEAAREIASNGLTPPPLFYVITHERGTPISWAAISSRCIQEAVRPTNGDPAAWAALFEALERRGHREWSRALRSRFPGLEALEKRLGMSDPDVSPVLRMVFLRVALGNSSYGSSVTPRVLRGWLKLGKAWPLSEDLLRRLETRIPEAEWR